MATTTRKYDWSDLDLDFIPNPFSRDVVKKTGIDAIKRSIRNLVLTNFYDKKFRSYVGSNTPKMLFENINQFTSTFLQNSIIEVIENFEPRARLTEEDQDRGVRVTPSPEENGYHVRISFIEVNREEPAIITMFLERIR